VIDDIRKCTDCKQLISADYADSWGVKPTEYDLNRCDIAECPDNCLQCQYNPTDDCMKCNICASTFTVNGNECAATTCSDTDYQNANNICTVCDATCSRCDATGCTACASAAPLLKTDDQTCVTACPAGFRENSLSQCVPCSAGCTSCYTRDDVEGTKSFETEVCLSCDGGANKFLNGDMGCLDTCPPGTYADTTFNWCVKCACGCETCSGSRDNCDICSGVSSKNANDECMQRL
jgi:hypothetical protein